MSIEVQPVAANAPTRRRNMPALLAGVLSIIVIAAGVAAAAFLIKTKKKPAKEPEEIVAPLVETVPAKLTNRTITLEMNGTVIPARKVVVMPEVGGRIVWLNDKLVPGGFVKAGERLVRIDGRDYALAMKQQRAQLQNQKLALEVETARKKIATKEWELFQQERQAAGLPAIAPSAAPPLAVRDPQLAGAKVNVTAAKSALSLARLRLGKTSLSAPFNAIVQMENVDKGQLVGPQSQLATLVGTDNFWVQLSIPLDRLNYVRYPSPTAHGEKGSAVTVWLDTGRGRIERRGHVIRLLSDLDPVGRMARLLVEVPDPLRLAATAHRDDGDGGDTKPPEAGAPAGSRLPLLLGSYVHVTIEGEEVRNVVQLPRRALQPNDRVFVLDGHDKLHIVKVHTLWGTDEVVLLRGGLKGGERVVVTPLTAPVEGMLVRTSNTATTKTPQRGKAAASSEVPNETEPAP